MEPNGNVKPTPEDIFTWKMNNSDEYQQRFLSDVKFAKEELENAGIPMDESSYNEFKDAFVNLNKIAGKFLNIKGKRLDWVAIYVRPPYQTKS